MILFKLIRRNLKLTFAIVENNIRHQLKFKFNLIISYISPLISIMMPIFLMSAIFSFNTQYGEWSNENFLVYQFIAFNISLIKRITGRFSGFLKQEVFGHTLPLILIAPFNTINLLFGIFITHFVMVSIPFIVVSIISYIYFPISIFTFFLIMILYSLIAFIFSGIGIILGFISIAKMKYSRLADFLLSIIFMFSCISFPFQIFPKEIQFFISLNPFYYIFDLTRSSWIDDNFIFTINENLINFFVLSLFGIIFPIISIYYFNKYYKVYGIFGA